MIFSRNKAQSQERRKNYHRHTIDKISAFLFIIAAILSGQLYWQDKLSALHDEILKHIQESDKFALQHVDVLGTSKLTRQYVIEQSNLKVGDNILAVDINAVHDALKRDGWIEEASISRIYPNTIRIQITEEVPQALWWNDEKFFLIAKNGKIIQEISAPEKPEHLLIFGKEAPTEYNNIYKIIANHSISPSVIGLSSIAGRRWDLYLNDGSRIMLPENNVEKALILLDKLHRNDIMNQKAIQQLDLRLAPENIFIKYK